MIVIINTGLSNVRSVHCALNRLEIASEIHDKPPSPSLRASGIILPGVGAYGEGMRRLTALGFKDYLAASVQQGGVPLLGICLGMQLLMEGSEEHGHHEGLGLIPGQVKLLTSDVERDRVPNIGWHETHPVRPSILFDQGPEPADFYYVHSFHGVAADPADVAATISFGGQEVTAALQRGHIHATQFHPEKSQGSGLRLLRRWSATLSAAQPEMAEVST